MRVKRLDQLEEQLASAETRLRAMLVDVLTRASTSGASIFFSSHSNPHRINVAHLPPESEVLYTLAGECVALRERLHFEVIGSVGQLFLSACAESANLANEHRRGPRQLAVWLLHELARSQGT